MTGPISVAGSSGSPITSISAAPRSIVSMRSATSSCRHNSRSEEQRWPAEPNAELKHVAHHLFGQCGTVDDHRVDPARLRDERHDRAGPGCQIARDASRCLGTSGERHPGDARIVHQRRADAAVARQQTQRVLGYPRLVQQLHRTRRDQRCLLGGLGRDGIAGGESGGHLSGEDREREIPR